MNTVAEERRRLLAELLARGGQGAIAENPAAYDQIAPALQMPESGQTSALDEAYARYNEQMAGAQQGYLPRVGQALAAENWNKASLEGELNAFDEAMKKLKGRGGGSRRSGGGGSSEPTAANYVTPTAYDPMAVLDRLFPSWNAPSPSLYPKPKAKPKPSPLKPYEGAR